MLAPAASQTTDNAYVDADATVLAPKVRGQIARVLAKDNQIVHAGDAVVEIDPEEFDARVATAEADLADAEAGVASARAALISLDAEERLAASNVRVAESGIRSAGERAVQTAADQRRYGNLVGSGAVAERDAEATRTTAVSAQQDLTRAVAVLDASRASEAVTRARRASLAAALGRSEALVRRAKAVLDLAMQDQRHATVVAPFDGVVGNRQVQQGDYVQPGTRLLTLVPLGDYYVTANFKETQITRFRTGQKVQVEIDAMPGEDFNATVDSLAPGSGSRFALLPFEPGTGNFTKIVQRVPVRIRFEPGQSGLGQLRPGLSATVKVSVRN
jgi:membrane fusion protein (multidrug efflux system)